MMTMEGKISSHKYGRICHAVMSLIAEIPFGTSDLIVSDSAELLFYVGVELFLELWKFIDKT